MAPLSFSRRAVILVAVAVVTASVVLGIAIHSAAQGPVRTVLPVPYVSQVPDGAWVSPWDEACEEASLLMVRSFYADASSVSKEDGKAEMRRMFAWEQEKWKDVEDADAERIHALGEAFGVKTRVVRDPGVVDIAEEVRAGRPVIAVLDMYALYHAHSAGDGFHVVVVTGRDAEKKQFQVMDPAKDEVQWYDEARLMGALHDYDPKTKEATGPATVLFTSDADGEASGSLWQRIRRFFVAWR